MFACAPGVAAAATVSGGDTITYTAGSGEANDLTVTSDGSSVTIVDVVPVNASSGCSQKDSHTATCPVAPLQVDLGDMDDIAKLSGVASAVVNGGTGHDSLSGASGALTLNGEGGDDVLNGGRDNDVLNGGSGRDLIDGGAAGDVMNGGPDDDTLDYSQRNKPVFVDLAASDAVQGGAGEGDSATGFEQAVGGAGNDVLLGSSATDVLSGGAGDDRLDGRAGADRLVGGPGMDTADYSARSESVALVIGGGPVSGSDSDRSSIGRDDIDRTVERVVGGSGNDKLTGDSGDNVLDGGPGADVLTGGGGEDAADYTDRTEPVTLRDDGQPGSGSAADGPAGARDTIAADVEDLWGGNGPDSLTGNSGDNLLSGGPGADVLTGGAGEDAADYSERSTSVVAAPDGKPTSGNDADGPVDARDTIAIDVEDLIGSQGDDILSGSKSRNYIDGEGGNDVIDVRDAGADYVDCGDGNDIGWVAPNDIPASDCERIGNGPEQTGPATGGPDKTRAQVRVSLVGKTQPKGQALAKGLALHFTCSETCTLDTKVYLGRTDARRIGIKLGPKRILLARGAAGRTGPGQGEFTLHLVPRMAKRLKLKNRFTLTLSLVGRDPAGNRTVVRARLLFGNGRVALHR